MKQNDLAPWFLKWFQNEYPGARIYRNNTGVAWNKDKHGKLYPVFFGIPLPKGKGKGGGGPDYISFTPFTYRRQNPLTEKIKMITILVSSFYEIKIKTDKMSKSQIDVANLFTYMSGNYYIVHETQDKLKTKNIVYQNEIFTIELWEIDYEK